MKEKIVFVELNEVPFRVLDDYCARHPQAELARRLPRLRQYETISEDQGHLSPWITWPTVHRGVANDRHAIACFGQDLAEVDRHFPPVWQLLAAGGVRTGVFGSLHSYARLEAIDRYAFYVPDTFAAGSECFPRRLSAFQEFNLAMVGDSARNVSSRIRWRPALKLLAQAPQLGLRAATLVDVAGQLLRERRVPERRARRRTYQAVLAFDIFCRELARTRPDFATFFTNHVASAMHRYWAARFPGDYAQFGFDEGWVATYRDEIDFALDRFDRCFGRLARFVERNREYQLWLATSMGQAATSAQPLETQVYLTDLGRFLAALGIPAGCWSRRPAMAPDVNFYVDRPEVAKLRVALEGLRIDGRPIERYEAPGGFFSLRLGHENLHHRPVAEFQGRSVAFEELGLAAVRIDDRSGTTAYHIPQGMLLVYNPRRPARGQAEPARRPQVSTRSIAPALLERFGLPVPGYMRKRPRELMAA